MPDAETETRTPEAPLFASVVRPHGATPPGRKRLFSLVLAAVGVHAAMLFGVASLWHGVPRRMEGEATHGEVLVLRLMAPRTRSSPDTTAAASTPPAPGTTDSASTRPAPGTTNSASTPPAPDTTATASAPPAPDTTTSASAPPSPDTTDAASASPAPGTTATASEQPSRPRSARRPRPFRAPTPPRIPSESLPREPAPTRQEPVPAPHVPASGPGAPAPHMTASGPHAPESHVPASGPGAPAETLSAAPPAGLASDLEGSLAERSVAGAVQRSLGPGVTGLLVEAPPEVSPDDTAEAERRAFEQMFRDRFEDLPYPHQARMAGIEGQFVLRISVGVQGQLVGLSVAGACPHAVLCEAALDAVRKAAPFPPPPPALGGTITVELPFNFHLE